ncbi:hypothetical protein PVE_R2G0890 [Pseudomonas veronii 1YdBTEX2]|jgi:hypothetical protein|uniref:Uncharacterized protein n=2 Tax=Pseudomonas TaxID=286 RepID=D5MPB6_PSEPU|nr:hypothetical protein [Pseudomonas putida]SBW84915.1 hypothetical protein PVE_R2G0890 [Pseudomonas veronii 1YdBTEX2]
MKEAHANVFGMGFFVGIASQRLHKIPLRFQTQKLLENATQAT